MWSAIEPIAGGKWHWPKTCGPVCARKRKTKMQAERRLLAWEKRVALAGGTPVGGFKLWRPDCLNGAGVRQSAARKSEMSLHCLTCGSDDICPGESGAHSVCASCGSGSLGTAPKQRHAGAHKPAKPLPRVIPPTDAAKLWKSVHDAIDNAQ